MGLLLASCGQPEQMRLGFLGGLSGRVADLGMAGRDGAQLAVDLRNQAGGVNGRKVVLLVRDDAQDKARAASEAGALLKEGVMAVIGPMTSDMAMTVAPIFSKAKVVCMSPTATSEALSGRDDYFFRVTGTTKGFSAANASYQLKTRRMSRVAAAFDLGNQSFSENWIDNFAEALARGGGKLVSKVGFTSSGNVNFARLASRLLASDPDGVVLAANAVDSSLICQQIRKLNPKLPITLADWAAQERLLELGGRAVEGVTVVQTFERENKSPQFEQMRQRYRKRYGREPGFAGTYGFDAANVLMDALAANRDGKSLKRVILARGVFECLQGKIRFDRFGDLKDFRCSVSVVENGRFVVKD